MTGDQASGEMDTRYMAKRKEDVLSTAKQYIEALGLPENLLEAMDATFDSLWNAIPAGTKYHAVEYFTEILVFHVLREKGLFTDPAAFCKASPLGDMPMFHRKWLLQYKRYLPPASFTRSGPSPRSYLAPLFEKHMVNREFEQAYERIRKIILPRMRNNNARMVAGVVCYAAYKSAPEQPTSLMRLLKEIGIDRASSVYNAARRFREQHGIDLDNIQAMDTKNFVKGFMKQPLAEASG